MSICKIIVISGRAGTAGLLFSMAGLQHSLAAFRGASTARARPKLTRRRSLIKGSSGSAGSVLRAGLHWKDRGQPRAGRKTSAGRTWPVGRNLETPKFEDSLMGRYTTRGRT
uniref:Uncharacterized protein n=1 Tax=Ixodes ricinus TaxID=34613 RepID=A0A6B0UJS9_IXORI